MASLVTEITVRASARREMLEITGIMKRASDKLLSFTATRGQTGASLRTAIGDLLAHIGRSISDSTLQDKILEMFNQAFNAGVTVGGLDPVLTQLRSEAPTTDNAIWTTQTAILFTLTTQCRIIADLTFESRNDVSVMQDRMKDSFDQAKEMAADRMDNTVYGLLVDLAAKLARYLADVALSLPTIVYYELRPMPALTMANRIYGDAGRTDELLQDNQVVHPAFVRGGSVRALSA